MNEAGDGIGRILLMDEEPPTRNHAVETLNRHGFEVDVASDGTRGLAMFKNDPSKYDAILASRSLPGIDGVELTKIVRRLEQKEQAALTEKNEAKAFKSGRRSPKVQEVRRVPIIAFTEMASQEDLRLCVLYFSLFLFSFLFLLLLLLLHCYLFIYVPHVCIDSPY